jgi:hypothetical protein
MVSLRSFSLFRSAALVGRRQKRPPPSLPQLLYRNKKTAVRRKGWTAVFFVPLYSSSSHVLYPTFGRATTATIPLHSFTLRRLRFTAFQPYYVCCPLSFQLCSFVPLSDLAPFLFAQNQGEQTLELLFHNTLMLNILLISSQKLKYISILCFDFYYHNTTVILLEKNNSTIGPTLIFCDSYRDLITIFITATL